MVCCHSIPQSQSAMMVTMMIKCRLPIVFSFNLTATAPKFDSFKLSHSLLPLISGQALRHKSLLILRQITLTHTLGRDSQKNNNDDNDNNNYADTVSSRSNTSLSHSTLSLFFATFFDDDDKLRLLLRACLNLPN